MANPFAAHTELLIMRMLRDVPGGMYGLELVKSSGDKLSRGTIYVTLGRMEEKGYVRSKAKENAGHSGIPRPVYRLTGAGERALMAAELAGWQFSEG